MYLGLPKHSDKTVIEDILDAEPWLTAVFGF